MAYQTTAAVKESFFDWYGRRYRLYQATNDNELTDPVAHAVDVTRIELPPYSDQGWRVMRVTRRIEPAEQPYAFEGRTFVLADNDTLSAGDSFVSAMRRTGLATVVGANTAGWGSGYELRRPRSGSAPGVAPISRHQVDRRCVARRMPPPCVGNTRP